MSTFFSKPWVVKTLRYSAAYALFFTFALLGLAITLILRASVIDLCFRLGAPAQTMKILYTWGTYLLFAPYILFIAFLEPYLHRAVKTNRLRARGIKVFAIEAGIGLLSLLLMLISTLLRHPQG